MPKPPILSNRKELQDAPKEQVLDLFMELQAEYLNLKQKEFDLERKKAGSFHERSYLLALNDVTKFVLDMKIGKDEADSILKEQNQRLKAIYEDFFTKKRKFAVLPVEEFRL